MRPAGYYRTGNALISYGLIYSECPPTHRSSGLL